MRRDNSDEVVWVCSNGNPMGVLYIDSCHYWIHHNIAKAKKEGYYVEMDGEYRPKKSSPSKWRLKKTVGYSS